VWRLSINLTPFRFLVGNPIPFIPFPLTRGRGNDFLREASPLFDSPLPFTPSKEGGRDLGEGRSPSITYTPPSLIERLFSKGIKRGLAPLRISLPSPIMKGRGTKGEGLLNNLLLREEGQGDRLLTVSR